MNAPQLPDYLKQRPEGSGVGQKLAGSLGAGAPPTLSIMGNRFKLVDPAGSEQAIETQEQGVPYVDAVVIDSLERISKIYFDRPFDGSNQPPTCFSDNGIGPSRNALSPQSTTCAACEKGMWGSAVSKVDPSKKVKACQDYQKLALMVPPNQGVYLLRVPPNSLKGLREYLARFGAFQMDPSDVLTRISFVKDVLGTLTFRGIHFIGQEVATRRNELLAAKAADQMLGRFDQPHTGQIAGPQEARPLAAPTAGFPLTETETPQQRALPSQDASPSKRPGRPRKYVEATPESNGPLQAPFPVGGIQQAQTPDAKLENTLDDFFGPAR